MMNEIEYLRQLYLEDLSKIVQYDTSKHPRSRVRNPQQYVNIPIMEQMDITKYDNIWFWSDTHFVHKNIIKYSNRPFNDVSHMYGIMLNAYNNTIGPNDLIIWGGDVAFAGRELTEDLLAPFVGDKILVIGNHDMVKKKLKPMNFLQHHLIFVIEHHETPLVVTHYPMDNVPEPYFNVHGHTHDRNTDNPKQINISVEVIDYKPINLNDILRIAKTRKDSIEET